MEVFVYVPPKTVQSILHHGLGSPFWLYHNLSDVFEQEIVPRYAERALQQDFGDDILGYLDWKLECDIQGQGSKVFSALPRPINENSPRLQQEFSNERALLRVSLEPGAVINLVGEGEPSEEYVFEGVLHLMVYVPPTGHVKPDRIQLACNYCFKSARYKCPCGKRFFCSVECQENDWNGTNHSESHRP